MLKIALIAWTVLTLAACPGWAGSDSFTAESVQRSGLTTRQTQQVLMMVLKHENFPVAKEGFYVEQLSPSHRGYQNFGVTLESENAAATTVLGSFVVSKMTGDVWETNLCKRYEFTELQRLQTLIMERTHKSFASEVKERRGLGCTNE